MYLIEMFPAIVVGGLSSVVLICMAASAVARRFFNPYGWQT